jgi:hypothetical protein
MEGGIESTRRKGREKTYSQLARDLLGQVCGRLPGGCGDCLVEKDEREGGREGEREGGREGGEQNEAQTA